MLSVQGAAVFDRMFPLAAVLAAASLAAVGLGYRYRNDIYRLIDRAAGKRLMHPNKAARLKSRLEKHIAAL